MCWSLVASLFEGQDTPLQHSQLPATSAMEVGLQTTTLLQVVWVLDSCAILSVALCISMLRCLSVITGKQDAEAPGCLNVYLYGPVSHDAGVRMIMHVP